MKDIIKVKLLSLYLKRPIDFPLPLWQINYFVDRFTADFKLENEEITSLAIINNHSLYLYWHKNNVLLDEVISKEVKEVLLNDDYDNIELLHPFHVSARYNRMLLTHFDRDINSSHEFKVHTIGWDKDKDLLIQFLYSLSHSQLSVTQLEFLTYRPVYHPDLWVGLYDRENQLIGIGIAERDLKINEGVIAHVHVLVEYSSLKKHIVHELIKRLKKDCNIISVITQNEDEVNLYRSLGFHNISKWTKYTK